MVIPQIKFGPLPSRSPGNIKVGVVEQFNVGLYSAVVRDENNIPYKCLVGAMNVTPGFGYSDANVLREGDEVIFCLQSNMRGTGMILARKPTLYRKDKKARTQSVESETKLDRRTSFLSSDCYRKKSPAYTNPVTNKNDTSTNVYTCNRPTDILSSETAMLNQHRCGFLGGIYSFSVLGGGAQIKLFSLENRIRVVADSIMQHMMTGSEQSWHNGRNLSEERSVCLYQEERLGSKKKKDKSFEKDCDYDTEGYYTKNKVERQTSKPRFIDQTGYYGNLSTKYCLRPDPDQQEERSMNDEPYDPGVYRESVDPSGQYRLAASGMIGIERIGRIPVPVRVNYPWQKEVKDPKSESLQPFKHDSQHPYYRQLELSDRVAYDLKNSYARVEEEGSDKQEFFVPEEEDLEGKLKNQFDPGFSDSETVELERYDKRRSGIWQGEDGSVILRDAWGSEIVMIGGNIQLSCAGNVQILPGKTALTLAGDDIVNKAHNSIDIESANTDVRINAFKNVQVMAGMDDDNPGGITLESRGKASAWDASQEGGESLQTSGIVLKSSNGAIVADGDKLSLRSRSSTGIISGKDEITGGDGKILMSASSVYTYGDNIISTSEGGSHLIIGESSAMLAGKSVGIVGGTSAYVVKGDRMLVPLKWEDIDTDLYKEMDDDMQPLDDYLEDEKSVSLGYEAEKLDKMHFKFRSSSECGTDSGWELDGPSTFTIYEPFWAQVADKFETLDVDTEEFEDHVDDWDESYGNPWPGKSALSTAKYAMLPEGPVNMTEDGMNVSRKLVKDSVSVYESKLFPGYLIRK